MQYRITSFVIAEAKRTKPGKGSITLLSGKSAPHYFPVSVPSQIILEEEKVQVAGREVSISIKSYEPDAVLVEFSFEVPNIWSEEVLDIKNEIQPAACRILEKWGGKGLSEEYSVYQVFDYGDNPDKVAGMHKDQISRLLKSERMPLGEEEIDYTLSFKFKYGASDLIFLDWDGAFVFDKREDSAEIIELLELVNYQLLKYRVLDLSLDEKIKATSVLAQDKKLKRWSIFPNREVSEELRGVIRARADSILKFESLERDIKLIGDWYFARLYGLIAKKFRLDGWRNIVKEKLESLESIYQIASENLGMSRTQRLEFIQIWAFFILQIGWFVLIILEFFYFTR